MTIRAKLGAPEYLRPADFLKEFIPLTEQVLISQVQRLKACPEPFIMLEFRAPPHCDCNILLIHSFSDASKPDVLVEYLTSNINTRQEQLNTWLNYIVTKASPTRLYFLKRTRQSSDLQYSNQKRLELLNLINASLPFDPFNL